MVYRCLICAVVVPALCVSPAVAAKKDKDGTLISTASLVPKTEFKPKYGEQIDSGYVFASGKVIEAPFRLGRDGNLVLVNDVVFADAAIGGRRRSGAFVGTLIAEFETALLRNRGIIALDESTRLDCEECDFIPIIQALVDAPDDEARVASVLESVSSYCATTKSPSYQLRTSLASFSPDEDLVEYLNDYVGEMTEDYDEEFVEDFSSFSDMRDSREAQESRMYTLNVLGMLLSVYSLGTLLSARPSSSRPWSETESSPDALRLMKRCLIIVVCLSLFDLSATIMTNSAGGFSELNPFALSLLDDPVHLSVFKFATTGMSVGILWSRRAFVGAQTASWWLCLILTLVAARWVTIHSLFYV